MEQLRKIFPICIKQSKSEAYYWWTPCQDFTMNGEGKGFDGERGKMTQIFYNRIRKMRPSFFVMENVVGLVMRKDSKKYLDTLLLNHICEDY